MFVSRIDDDLELRLLEEPHAEELFALVEENREYLRQWLPWVDGSRSAADTKTFILRSREKFATNGGFSVGVWFRGKLVGVIGLHEIDWDNRRVDIGYWIAEPFQGRGIITRGCRAVVEHAFNGLGLHRVEIHCATGNSRSRAIPERLGFRQEGVLRHRLQLGARFVDLVVYGILADEWSKARAGSAAPKRP